MDVFSLVKRSPILLALACIAAAAMLLVSEASYWRSVGRLDELGAMGAARTSIQAMTQALVDAESGQRGYLITGRRDYLGPYHSALARIDKEVAFLDQYYGQTAEAADALRDLHRLIDAKLSELAATIRTNESGRTDLAKELVMSGIGKEKMDAIRTIGARLLERETAKVVANRAAVYRTLAVGRAGVALLTALSLLALLMYFRKGVAMERQQRERQQEILAERDRLEVEVTRRTQQLTELARHLQTAREDERSRLARDLHDELGALLTSAKLDAARIRSRLGDTAPEAQTRLAHLVDTLNSGIALKRRIIEDLRPSALSNLGLVATLEILAREYADLSGVQLHRDFQPVSLDADAQLVVYRLVQEAITNITKYAKARQVWIALHAADGRAEVSVRDDGVGFDPSALPRSGHGLVGMRYRVEAEGGNMTVISAPGQGTEIRASIPESAPGA